MGTLKFVGRSLRSKSINALPSYMVSLGATAEGVSSEDNVMAFGRVGSNYAKYKSSQAQDINREVHLPLSTIAQAPSPNRAVSCQTMSCLDQVRGLNELHHVSGVCSGICRAGQKTGFEIENDSLSPRQHRPSTSDARPELAA